MSYNGIDAPFWDKKGMPDSLPVAERSRLSQLIDKVAFWRWLMALRPEKQPDGLKMLPPVPRKD